MPPLKAENVPTQVSPSLVPSQQRAVDLCCDTSEKIVGITGGAGVGKTLVLGVAYRELKSRRNSIALCAPTGRAAKRIYELTGIKAKTVHRLLEFPMPDDLEKDHNLISGEPKRNRLNRLDEGIVFVDESSMLSPTIYRQLMDALPPGGCIRFFGDNNQLPPVEEGVPPFIAVLEDFSSITLTHNFRSDDMIVHNAMRILNGRIPERFKGHFEIFYDEDPIMRLIRFVTKEFAEDNCQIIMPTRKGKFGTLRVNPSLQMKFNGKGVSLKLPRNGEKEALLPIRANDKYLFIKNDYKLNIFNGEIGRVSWVDPEEGSLALMTSEGEIEVPPRLKTFSSWHGTVIDYDPRKQIELGYAITTHKAQGSEFETVVLCISSGQFYTLNRRNFYTAVTRAKQRVIIITDTGGMRAALRYYNTH